jgi:hypothetical protein
MPPSAPDYHTRMIGRSLPARRPVRTHQPMLQRPNFLPMIGVIGAFVGMVWAVITTPESVSEPGALAVPAAGLAIGLAAAPFLAAASSLRNLFRTENVIALCPAYWALMDLIQGSYEMPNVRQGEVTTVFMCIGLYSCLFWCGTMGRKWTLPKALRELGRYRPTDGSLISLSVLMFVLGMLTFAVPSGFNPQVMLNGLMADRWGAPWSRGGLGGWNAIIDHFAYFGYLLPTVAAMLLRRNGVGAMSGWVVIGFSVVFFAFVAQGGSRRIVGACVVAAIIYTVLDMPKLRYYHLLVAGVFVAGLLWVMQVMLISRNMGAGGGALSAASSYVTDSMTGKIKTRASKLAVDDNFFRQCQVAAVIPRLHPYVYFQYIGYVLARPIPRALWKNKPVDGGFAIHYIVNEGASLSTTVIGELYMSWGLMACMIGGWLVGRLSGLGDELFNSVPGSFGSLIYGYITTWLLVGFRSMQELVLFSYPLMALIVLSNYLRNFTRSN